MFRSACALLLTLFALPLAPVLAAPLPIQDFVRHERYGTVKISPNGEYLASTVKRGDIDVLVVFSVATKQIVGVNQLPDEKSVFQFYWVSNDRLMFNAIRNEGRFAQPFSTGEWFSVNADGSQPQVLIHYDAVSRTERGKAAGNQRFSMLDPLPADPRRALMQATSPRSADGVNTEIVYVDVFTGRRTSVARAPRSNCSITLDNAQQPKFAVCSDYEDDAGTFDENTELYRREGGEWVLANRSASDGKSIEVLGVAGDGRIYALQDDKKVPAAFGFLDPATAKFTSVFQDPVAEVSRYVVASDNDTILGVVTEAGVPKVTLIEEEHPDVAIYQALAAGFPGQFVNFASATEDGSKIVVSVSSDRNPGELYLFDRKTGRAEFMMRRRDWIDPKQMAPMRAISYRTRDGLTIYGYLTLPVGVEAKNLPLIINPHGGPIGPRDDWGYNWEVQMFANRGYAVLQVNYRGSGGFGEAFEEMGHREWGGKMQDDLTDATRWAIEQGYADPKRICIYGASYGGYASLMGVAKEPDLYQCAAGYVGAYDVQIQRTLSDTSKSEMGLRYLDRTLGTSRAEQDRASPVNHADKIKAAVFLAAGARDPRCPPENTEAMRDALIAAGNPPEETIIASGEMHGFFKEETNLDLYTRMLAFFDRHIGSRRGQVDVGDPRTQP